MKKNYDKEKRLLIKYAVGCVVLFAVLCLCVTFLGGCERESYRVKENISKEADNFNIVRQVTVIDCITGDTLFQMSGKMSITADTADNQLEMLVEDNGKYMNHIIGLSDNVTYIVEDLNLGKNDVTKYHYVINFNPKMWLPYSVENMD